MNDSFLTAQVAVEKAAYSFDEMYTYLVPDKMADALRPGCRVKVSFGHGLRQGMVFALGKRESAEGLKEISMLLDREPVMSEEMLSLAVFMKEHCFCTYFEACAAMLPAGLSVKLTYSFRIAPDADENTMLLSDEERSVVTYLRTRRTSVRQDRLIKLSGTDENILRDLTEKGIILREETVHRRIADKYIKMIRLCGDIPGKKYSPAQEEVLKLLSDIGEASVSEICYFTGVTASVTDNLVRKGICEYFEAQPPAQQSKAEGSGQVQEIMLTERQDKAFRSLLEKYTSPQAAVSLLYGITGSGKTAVFMKLIDEAYAQGRGVICMVPEISLTPGLIDSFTARYGEKIAVFHSALSLGKRLEEWKRVKNGEATIAVGTRSAIFAPMKDIGLIVMDEEQEYSYKSAAAPRFHTRELAKFRCMKHNALLLLASATPSVESYSHALSGRYSLCTLSERYGNAMLPHVIVADMNREQQQGNSSGYSSVLLEAMDDNLKNSRQSILLLNRRGHNTFIACRSCNSVISCPNCSISMTYHSANHRLMCHYCGYAIPVPKECPKCGSEKLRYAGAGTQRAEQELQTYFPDARILRLDTDSTMQRYSYEKKLGAFRRGEYDIMLGTQMVAKGLDFPNVTLVGVLSADGMMHGDDFRSYERTFSLLTQVVGRSGRGGLEGRAVIQTYEPENPIIGLAAAQNYDEFFRSEISLRKTMLYPPYSDLCVIAFIGQDKQTVHDAAQYFSDALKKLAGEDYPGLPLRVMGPAPAIVARVSGKYRFRLIIKFKNSRDFRTMISQLLRTFGSCRQFRDVTAYADIDPENIM